MRMASSLISPAVRSPEIRPFRITSTRSAFADQLGDLRGDQDNRDALGGDAAQDGVDLRLGADVDAARRLVQDEHARMGDEAAAEKDLLLIAARKRAEPVAELADPGMQTSDLSAHLALDNGAPEKSAP